MRRERAQAYALGLFFYVLAAAAVGSLIFGLHQVWP